ncbi:MAG: prepilin-type N-terminal cleavage/methylation domain-containing protein [Candidatus Harrisonbacteria bacterium]|nr:prepilin-type N-terminal cleavage/methylation domain-containing protein [Candidatus Harrisonbacteria bacterium]
MCVHTKKQNGFTVVEVLIAIAVVSVLASLSVAYFNSFLARNELQNESLKVVDSLRRARGQSMARQEDSQWGVHFESNKYVLFKGSSYSAADSYNEEITLPDVLTISTINLNGGGSDVVFNKITGETLNFGTTTIQNDLNESKNIVINSYGTIEIR